MGLRYNPGMTQPSGAFLRGRIEQLLQIPSESKAEVYLKIFGSAEVLSTNYALELVCSAGIATLGLVLNSPAVIIGAMLISPLMDPILAAGLALAAADLYLGLKALLSLLVGAFGAVLFSAGLVWLLPFQSVTSEILARTRPNLLDLGVALFSGLAGSVVVSRSRQVDGSTALPGVAIAVALMPPLCTVGFGIGSGFSWPIISGASLLFLTNLAAIIASAFVVFYVVRMDSPDVRAKIDDLVLRNASSDRLFLTLQNTKLSAAFGHVGKLRWRILMLVTVLAFLFVPLSRALLEVRDETISRAAVREAMRLLGPADAFVTQQVDILPRQIVIRLVASTPIPKDKLAEAEKLLLRRTGKEVNLMVRRVASEEELAVLRRQLKPAPPPPVPQDLESVRTDVLTRLEAPLKEIWSPEAGEILSYELGFAPEGTVVRIRYRSSQPLDAASQQMLSNVLKKQLNVQALRVDLLLEKPASPPARQRYVRRGQSIPRSK